MNRCGDGSTVSSSSSPVAAVPAAVTPPQGPSTPVRAPSCGSQVADAVGHAVAADSVDRDRPEPSPALASQGPGSGGGGAGGASNSSSSSSNSNNNNSSSSSSNSNSSNSTSNNSTATNQQQNASPSASTTPLSPSVNAYRPTPPSSGPGSAPAAPYRTHSQVRFLH